MLVSKTTSKALRVTVLAILAAASLASCAKKDSDFKGRKNPSGAALVGDPSKNNRAGTDAAANGLNGADIVQISDPTLAGQAIQINSSIVANGLYYNVSTTHTVAGQWASTTSQIDGGFTLTVAGKCADSACSPYYLSLEFRKNGQPIKQIVQKHFFFGSADATNPDYVIYRSGAEFMPIDQALQLLDNPVLDDQE
jgi:hypothetical protein